MKFGNFFGRKKSEGVVTFLPDDRDISFSSEASVLDIALSNGIDIDHSCGGMASCTTCRVFVESDLTDLPARNPAEQEIIEGRNFKARERLSCQLPPLDGLVVRRPTKEV